MPSSRTTTHPNWLVVNCTSNTSGRSLTSASCSAIVCFSPTVAVRSHR